MSLTNREIMIVVNRYIGVSGGYLGDFSYRTHAEFYAEYCDIEVDLSSFEGTTRERFIQVLSSRTPGDQAKILRGVLDKFGNNDQEDPARLRVRTDIEDWIRRLESGSVIDLNNPGETRVVVLRALNDADELLRTTGPTSAVDRIHTALHGHILALCETAGIQVEDGATSAQALKALRREHPNFQVGGPRADDVVRVLNSMANVLDALNPIRNNASVAHPNRELLDEPEALLAINAARTVFAYLDAKLGTGS